MYATSMHATSMHATPMRTAPSPAATTQADSDSSLLVAASLRGLRLHSMPGKLYALYRVDQGAVVPIGAWLDVAAVRSLLGAGADVSLRAAAERDGLGWPATPAAFLDVMTALRSAG